MVALQTVSMGRVMKQVMVSARVRWNTRKWTLVRHLRIWKCFKENLRKGFSNIENAYSESVVIVNRIQNLDMYSLGWCLEGKYWLFFMDIKPCAWFIIRRPKIVELIVLYIGNFSPRLKILGGKAKYGGLLLNFSHSPIFLSMDPHNLSLNTIFYTL